MKWTLTSPDGIGDFLLRLPWLREMERRGWKLQLLARDPTLEAARLFGLGGEFVPLGVSPYSKKAKERRDVFAEELELVRKFNPDLVFLGPAQPSMLEEYASESLSDFRLAGFVLDSAFWPSECVADPREIAGRFATSVPIRDEDSEPLRNSRAAEVLLGGTVHLPACRLDSGALDRLPDTANGLASGSFLVVSPGYREGDYFQGFGVENWVRELRDLEARTDLAFVFVGGAAEQGSNARIFSQLREAGRHRDLTGKIPTLGELAALLNGAKAYVGKDSGAMHLAAALQKPVVAAFGGGHGRRFYPTGTRGVVLTVDVPCRGCDWRCHLDEPLCVRDLSAGSIGRAWEALEGLASGEILVWEQLPSDAAQRALEEKPQGSFPQIAHEKRKAGLRRHRDGTDVSLSIRLRKKLARTIDQIRRAR